MKRTHLSYHRHGHSKGGVKTATYCIWSLIKTRCHKVGGRDYNAYGGRGIFVCDRWLNNFPAFLADMGERPSGMSLDRIDNDGPYSPDNCRWATQWQQNRNKHNTRRITFGGETLCITDWAARQGLCLPTLGKRLRKGWSLERALFTPTRKFV